LGHIQDQAVENGCFSAQDLAQFRPELWGQAPPAGGGDDQGVEVSRCRLGFLVEAIEWY